MNPYKVPTVPTVRIRATYDCTYFPEGWEDPADWGGWCDPSNPWGTLDDAWDPDDDSEAYGRGEPIELVMSVYEAADFLAVFPGGIWDATESESEMNMFTGVCRRVTAHVDGPGAEAALTIMSGEVGA